MHSYIRTKKTYNGFEERDFCRGVVRGHLSDFIVFPVDLQLCGLGDNISQICRHWTYDCVHFLSRQLIVKCSKFKL